MTKARYPRHYITAFMLAISAYSNAALPLTIITPDCAPVEDLIKLSARNEFFEETPENFIDKSKAYLTITKNEKISVTNGSVAVIGVAPSNGEWLKKGTLKYNISDAQKSQLASASFIISQTCFENPKDFLAAGEKNINKNHEDTKVDLDEPVSLRTWTIKDTDPNMHRTITFSGSRNVLEIKIKREPVPTKP